MHRQNTILINEKAGSNEESRCRGRAELNGMRVGIYSRRRKMRQIVQKRLTETGILESNLEVGPDVTERVACIIMGAFEKVTEKGLLAAEIIEGIG
jgi:hypothetical protein